MSFINENVIDPTLVEKLILTNESTNTNIITTTYSLSPNGNLTIDGISGNDICDNTYDYYSFTILDGVTTIPESAFTDLDGIKNVTIPDTASILTSCIIQFL